MMLDIDNEFDEIDSLLRDVESLKIATDPNHKEHKEESKNNAPTDWYFKYWLSDDKIINFCRVIIIYNNNFLCI